MKADRKRETVIYWEMEVLYLSRYDSRGERKQLRAVIAFDEAVKQHIRSDRVSSCRWQQWAQRINKLCRNLQWGKKCVKSLVKIDISFSKSVKYLRITLDSELKWRTNFEDRTKRLHVKERERICARALPSQSPKVAWYTKPEVSDVEVVG